MLELYRVPDGVLLDQFIQTQGLGYDLKQIYLGGLNLDEHMQLTEMVPEVNRLPFFEDSQLKSVQVKALYTAVDTFIDFQSIPQNKINLFDKFRTMLHSVIQYSEGIIALCD
jgi:hypothetical protein